MEVSFVAKRPDEIKTFLLASGIEESICQVVEDNEIDGEAFLELTIDDVKTMVPGKLGVVKKICRLIKLELVNISDSSPITKSQSPDLFRSPSGSSSTCKQRADTPSSSRRSFSPTGLGNRRAFSPASNDTLSISSVSTKKVFEIPDTWRPTIIDCLNKEDETERRKMLTWQVRCALVRDLVTTMFAHMPEPDTRFCKRAARMLIEKYPFMKDLGVAACGYGSWEKKILESVSNRKKAAPKRKRQADDGVSSPVKRGRPKLSPTLCRYPPLEGEEEDKVSASALQAELEKYADRARKDIILPLLKKTFVSRRQYILDIAKSVREILGEHKVLKLQFALEREIDLILFKRDVVKVAVADWKCKWAPAISAYADSCTGKAVRSSVKTIKAMYPDDEEREEKIALALLSKFLLRPKKDETPLSNVYSEYTMAEDPDNVAQQSGNNAPRIACFGDPESSNTYYLMIEKRVLCEVSGSFCKALLLWFISHYVFHLEYLKDTYDLALFFQEFVLGLPGTGSASKKTSTYLTVCSDIQIYSAH